MSFKFIQLQPLCIAHVLFLLIISIQTGKIASKYWALIMKMVMYLLCTEEPTHVNIVVSTSNGAVDINSTVYLACVVNSSKASAPSISWTKNHVTNITNSTSCRVSQCNMHQNTNCYDSLLQIVAVSGILAYPGVAWVLIFFCLGYNYYSMYSLQCHLQTQNKV